MAKTTTVTAEEAAYEARAAAEEAEDASREAEDASREAEDAASRARRAADEAEKAAASEGTSQTWPMDTVASLQGRLAAFGALVRDHEFSRYPDPRTTQDPRDGELYREARRLERG